MMKHRAVLAVRGGGRRAAPESDTHSPGWSAGKWEVQGERKGGIDLAWASRKGWCRGQLGAAPEGRSQWQRVAKMDI